MSKKTNDLDRVVIVDGVRSPIGRAFGSLKELSAVDLGVESIKQLLSKLDIDPKEIDEVIFGNVSQPVDAANITRVIALRAGLDQSIPAYTVHRNCASGMESISTAMGKIALNQIDTALVGGIESMSNIPLLLNEKMTRFFYNITNKKLSSFNKIQEVLKFRPSYLKPRIAVIEGLKDPVIDISMGQTAEILAKEFGITREEQDIYSLSSHQKSLESQKNQIFNDEIFSIFNPKTNQMVLEDECPRESLSIEKLAKLNPYFDKNGTVTVGNACPINDGSCSILLMKESKARELSLKPLGYIHSFTYAGLAPERMGLGPVFATDKILKQNSMTLKDIDLIEINEAFAAQVLACLKAFDSSSFSKKELGNSKKLGAIDPSILNVNGGAIALGHPVGTTGARLILTLLKELKRSKKHLGLATLCIGGGQGGAMIVENAS